jgi:hypothetical protein
VQLTASHPLPEGAQYDNLMLLLPDDVGGIVRHASLASIVIVLFLGAASSAHANPMLATYEGQFNAGPLTGSLFTVNYWFDAPPQSPVGFAQGSWPISSVAVSLGGNQVLSSHNPGFSFLFQGGGNIFGPFWTLPVPALPVGLLEWGFSGDPSYYYQYSNSSCAAGTCFVIDSFTNVTVTPVSVPEPSTLFIATGALASFAIGVRGRTRRRLPR